MSTCPPPTPDVHPPMSTDPEPVGPIAETVLDDLAARRQATLDRLRRTTRTRQETQR